MIVTFQNIGAELHPIIKLYTIAGSLIKDSGVAEALFRGLAPDPHPPLLPAWFHRAALHQELRKRLPYFPKVGNK